MHSLQQWAAVIGGATERRQPVAWLPGLQHELLTLMVIFPPGQRTRVSVFARTPCKGRRGVGVSGTPS